MKALKSLTSALLLVVLVFGSGCDTLDNDESEIASISEANIETATTIMAESLSDQNEGLMASLNDMTASVGGSSLSYDRRSFSRSAGSRPCRGLNREYERTYDENTGVHTVIYSRDHEGQNCQKSIDVTLNYTFTDEDGNFIATPRLNQDSVAEVAFEGNREGSSSFTARNGNERTRNFSQTGNWNLSGILTDVATLSGEQNSIGDYAFTRQDSSGNPVDVSGTYNISLNTVDVTVINTDGDEDLENEITGQLAYTIMMTRTVNGETREETVEGTIELEGNGRALLRFNGLRQLYRINLSDAEVEEAR